MEMSKTVVLTDIQRKLIHETVDDFLNRNPKIQAHHKSGKPREILTIEADVEEADK